MTNYVGKVCPGEPSVYAPIKKKDLINKPIINNVITVEAGKSFACLHRQL